MRDWHEVGMALSAGSGDGMGCGGCSLANISISVFSRDSVIFARESELNTPLYGLNFFLGFFFSGGGCCWYWNHICRLVQQRMSVGQGPISLLTSYELLCQMLAFKISFNPCIVAVLLDNGEAPTRTTIATSCLILFFIKSRVYTITRMTMPVQPSYDTEAAQPHLPAQAGGKPSSCTPFTLCAPDNSLSPLSL